MFDIGFSELLMIGIVALLVVGPQRLPKIAFEAGLWIGRIQRYLRNARMEIERELHNYEIQQTLKEQAKQLESVQDIARETQQALQQGMRTIDGSEKMPDIPARAEPPRSDFIKTDTPPPAELPEPDLNKRDD